jgi:signal transduction histidine kinase
MKKSTPGLSQRYLAALRAHLAAGHARGAVAARALGRDALASGYGTLDLARIHDEALVALASTSAAAKARHHLLRRAGKFFTEALVPLEKGHRATRESLDQQRQRAETFRLHAAALAKGNRQLRREVVRRKAGEEAVRRGKEQIQGMLIEAQLTQKKLRHVTRQVLVAHENERRQISRELHDDVAQTLVGINVELATLGAAGALNPRTLRARIARTQRLVEKSVNAVHQFARELRPAVLDDLGLIPALQVYLERLSARKKLIINLTAFAGIEALENEKRTVLFRVAQEALTNVARHAEAGTVNLILSELPGAVRMEVNDDGKSFSVLRTLSARNPKRLGLLGMRERVEMIGGTLCIESAPGQGTSIRVELPAEGKGAK